MATTKKSARSASSRKTAAAPAKTGTASKKSSTSLKKSGSKAQAPQSKPDQTELLKDFFCEELKDIYWAEKHLLKVLPKMAKNATAAKLKQAFENHRKVTEGHVTRLESVFQLMGKKAQAKKCEAMAGITKEGDDIIDETDKGTETRDVGLILAAQKVEHYEIATYGGLAELARTIGKPKVAEILEKTLAEEKDADKSLSELAVRNINRQASKETENGTGFLNKVMEVFS
jgi:ferritin-like metal-binding protein YciE